MLKKTLIAAAAAGTLGLGVIGTAAPASAASVQFGGPNWTVTIGNGQYNPYHQYQPGRFCQPVTKKVKWWDRWGRPHWDVVVVGQKCPPPKFFPHNYGPHPYNPGPFPGPYHPGPHW
jgi:hypothetical protein